MEEKIIRPKNDPPKQTPATKSKKSAVTEGDDEDEEEDDEDEEDEDVPLSDLEDEEDREDVVPHTKLTINNKAALLASLERIRIDTGSSVPFATHQSLSSSKPTADAIPDISDDLQRELALLSQSLEAARKGRALLIKEKVPFSRPSDYFAEMVKDDGQMEKVRSKLVEEATAKKAAAEARKLRDLKKFGKQVQIAKLQERQKAKRETLEKIKTLKKSEQPTPSPLVANTRRALANTDISRLHRASRKRHQRRRRHRGRSFRCRRRRGAQGLLCQGQGRLPQRSRPGRRRPQRQETEEERKVRLRRQEASRKVGRCHELWRRERVQQPSWRRRRLWARRQAQGSATGKEPQEVHG